MYNAESSGRGICLAHDQEFINQLKKLDITHLLSIFDFAHMEYPDGTEAEGYETLNLLKAVCPVETKGCSRTSDNSNGWNLNPNNDADSTSFAELYAISTILAEEHDLSDTFIAHQCDATSNHVTTCRRRTFHTRSIISRSQVTDTSNDFGTAWLKVPHQRFNIPSHLHRRKRSIQRSRPTHNRSNDEIRQWHYQD